VPALARGLPRARSWIRSGARSRHGSTSEPGAEAARAFSKAKLPIVDEPGSLPLEPDAAHLCFQLVSRRCQTGAMPITTHGRLAEWGVVLPIRRSRPRCSIDASTAAMSRRSAATSYRLPRQAQERTDQGVARR
jgi:DNA replication protein DnaC